MKTAETAGRADVVLVAFYNRKALGVRFLEGALERAGYRVRTVFFKDFNSVRPRPATDRELDLLRGVVRDCRPALVGLSVMSSMYLDTVYRVLDALTAEGRPPWCAAGPMPPCSPSACWTGAPGSSSAPTGRAPCAG